MQRERPSAVHAALALTDKGWEKNVTLKMGLDGHISTVDANTEAPHDADTVEVLLPGMANLHSHAFQFAMAGLAEKASPGGQDSFWSWREVMYAFAQNITPDQLHVIARALYIELLKHGYTAVGEFHYLHQQKDGTPYDNPLEMSLRILAAAGEAGIYLTHLPVFYQTGDFGNKEPSERQKRFIHKQEDYFFLLESLQKLFQKQFEARLGIAPHSLRAIPPDSLKALLEALPELKLDKCPKHIHIAEQLKEFEACRTALGKSPVAWLLDNADVDETWCLVHATHMTKEEITALAATSAVAGLCPTTESNLGDGIFPGAAYIKQGGAWGIGSDSNVGRSPFAELQLLEYSQRLATRSRNVFAGGESSSTGYELYTSAAIGGASALGIRSGQIAPGMRADFISIRRMHPLLFNTVETLLDTLIFAVPCMPVENVYVLGRRIVKNGKHPDEESALRDFQQVLVSLKDTI